MTARKRVWCAGLACALALAAVAGTPGMAHASSRSIGTTFGWFNGFITVLQDFGLGVAAIFGAIAAFRMMRGRDGMEEGKKELGNVITGGAVLFSIVGIIATVSGRGALL